MHGAYRRRPSTTPLLLLRRPHPCDSKFSPGSPTTDAVPTHNGASSPGNWAHGAWSRKPRPMMLVHGGSVDPERPFRGAEAEAHLRDLGAGKYCSSTLSKSVCSATVAGLASVGWSNEPVSGQSHWLPTHGRWWRRGSPYGEQGVVVAICSDALQHH